MDQETDALEPNDWDINPDSYLRDDDGNFILKKDGTPRKKAGKPKGTTNSYHHHSLTKAKISTRRKISRRQRELEKLERKVETKRLTLKKTKEVAKKLDGNLGSVSKKDAIVSETDLDLLPQEAKERILNDEAIIAFRPNPGPQTDFLSADEKDVLYGGAAGGGKSYAMLVDPLRYVHERDHKALILRRTLKELDELIDKSRELYPLAYPGAQYKESKKVWEFPSGCKIQFGYLEKDADVYQYQGQSFTWIGFDELTHLPTSFAWDYLRSRLRTTNPRIKCYMRATTNPGGPGHLWVKARYIDPAPENTTFWSEDGHVSRKFIPAKLSDNPSLAKGGEYEAMLQSMDPIHRKRLLEGDWNVTEGAAFPEFSTEFHVIPPFQIPTHWEKFKAIDYGYRAPSCCLWIAVDPSDGTLIVYRELYERELTGTKLGYRMHDLEVDEVNSIMGVLDGAAWNNTGNSGPSVGEEITRTGHKLRRADKNREAGKIQVHERLRINPSTGRPKTQIFNTCTNIIKQLASIPLDPSNKEDVDTKAEDHAYDAFRYAVMSRPRMDDPWLRMMKYKQQRFVPFDSDFGY